jgi:hypothetical protein
MKANGHRSRLGKFSRFGIIPLLTIVAVWLAARRDHSSPSELAQRSNEPTQKGDRPSTAVPLAPSPLPLSKRKSATNSPSASSTQALSPELALSYDENLSFEANLSRLKEFCRSLSGDPRLQQLLDAFVKDLLAYAKTELPVIKRALAEVDGTASYRNLLLMCLTEADGGLPEKTDIVWRIARDSREPVEVRRTASFLTAQLGDGRTRPADLFALLSDSDSQVVVFALQGATRNLDQENYDFIRTNLIHSTDVHVQVAAVHALGNASSTDKQSVLLCLLNDIPTSRNDAISEPSLVKRSALAYLDIHDSAVLQAVKTIALNDGEDPRVRAKAIERLTPAVFPELSQFLIELLGTLDNIRPLQRCEDTEDSRRCSRPIVPESDSAASVSAPRFSRNVFGVGKYIGLARGHRAMLAKPKIPNRRLYILSRFYVKIPHESLLFPENGLAETRWPSSIRAFRQKPHQESPKPSAIFEKSKREGKP